jgi:SAM-dependent methyltransferase
MSASARPRPQPHPRHHGISAVHILSTKSGYNRAMTKAGRWSERLRLPYHSARAAQRLLRHPTIAPRHCNICGYEGPFYPLGTPPRLDAGCASCKSFERHRLLKLWADDNPAQLQGRKILHFAPERAVRSFIEPLAANYITADIDPRNVDHEINIEDIAFDDGFCDVVICSHVLEHVDDRKALAELHRILRPDGLLLMMTPVNWAWDTTYEDPSITSPRERLLHFGQSDHVRYFGADIVGRIEEAGFDVSLVRSVEPAVRRHGLLRSDVLFLCRKG